MKKEEQEESELEETLEEDELENIADEIEQEPQEFDEESVFEFLSRARSTSPVLERVIREQEVNLETVASTSQIEPEERDDEVREEGKYNGKNEYEAKDDYESPWQDSSSKQMEVRNIEENSKTRLGLQEVRRGDERKNYAEPKTLDSPETSPPHLRGDYKPRKFK